MWLADFSFLSRFFIRFWAFMSTRTSTRNRHDCHNFFSRLQVQNSNKWWKSHYASGYHGTRYECSHFKFVGLTMSGTGVFTPWRRKTCKPNCFTLTITFREPSNLKLIRFLARKIPGNPRPFLGNRYAQLFTEVASILRLISPAWANSTAHSSLFLLHQNVVNSSIRSR